mmetsp:Transcript_24107/g.43408  ORF Transcript_24107/g.43408 Transcript_24107/m.43408 type:complete len:282 (+) Transcript_24107:129-974(+)
MGSSTPVVVQGTAVASPYDHNTTTTSQQQRQSSSPAGGTGEKQPTSCRDPIFALLLYANVASIVAVAGIYGTAAFGEAIDDSTSGYNYEGYVYATAILGLVAIVLSGLTLPIMMCIPELLIKVSLVMMLILSGVMMVLSFLSGSIFGGIFGVSVLAIILMVLLLLVSVSIDFFASFWGVSYAGRFQILKWSGDYVFYPIFFRIHSAPGKCRMPLLKKTRTISETYTRQTTEILFARQDESFFISEISSPGSVCVCSDERLFFTPVSPLKYCAVERRGEGGG